MLAVSAAREPAPLLALRGVVGTTRVRPTAFGNALGQGLVDEMQSSGYEHWPDQTGAEDARLDRYQAAALAQEAANNRTSLNAFNRENDPYYSTSYESWPNETAGESAKHERNNATLSDIADAKERKREMDALLNKSNAAAAASRRQPEPIPARPIESRKTYSALEASITRPSRPKDIWDRPDLLEWTKEQIALGKAAVAKPRSYTPSPSMDMEGPKVPVGHQATLRDDDPVWRDSKGQATQGPDRYRPVGDRKGPSFGGDLGLVFQYEDKQIYEIPMLGELSDELLVPRRMSEQTAAFGVTKQGLTLGVTVEESGDMTWARRNLQFGGLAHSNVSVRSVVSGAFTIDSSVKTNGEFDIGMGGRLEFVVLQAQGVVESEPVPIIGGAQVKVKGVGVLNAGALGGFAVLKQEYNDGVFRTKLGVGASALIGAGGNLDIEVDMSRFSVQQLIDEASKLPWSK